MEAPLAHEIVSGLHFVNFKAGSLLTGEKAMRLHRAGALSSESGLNAAPQLVARCCCRPSAAAHRVVEKWATLSLGTLLPADKPI
jgi:hypothetical protein